MDLIRKMYGDIDNSASFDFSLEPEFLFVNSKWYEDTFIWQPNNSIELDSDHTVKLIGYKTTFNILYNHLNKGSYNLFNVIKLTK